VLFLLVAAKLEVSIVHAEIRFAVVYRRRSRGAPMSTYRLEILFRPRSVAIVGASPRERSLGRSIIRCLRDGAFESPVHVVNPHYGEIEGIATVGSLEEIAGAVDVVVIVTPPAAVPDIVAAAGAKGASAAIIITAGLGQASGSLAEAAERAARAHGMRLIGPNCLGVMVPSAKFNASFAAHMPRAGDLALVSQSGAIVAGMAEWSVRHAIGFSALVSIGDQIDVDVGDLLDFFALDRATRAILLYVESVKDARKFMSAARAAARAKPVIIVKSGRHAQAARAAATHTGALAGSDAVYEAAFRRAGVLRVYDLEELFEAAETLGRLRPYSGKRLAVLTNGGGVGVLAIDRLVDLGGVVAELSADTRARLDAALPPTWSKGNPIDIIGDADGERYACALDALLADPKNDAILVMNVPTALASPATIASRVVEVTRAHRENTMNRKPVLGVWVGADDLVARSFESAGIPHYTSETEAVRGFMHVVRWSEAREALMQAPPSLPEQFSLNLEAARRVIDAALADRRGWLDPIEIHALFVAYGIPMVPSVLAVNADAAASSAAAFLAAGLEVVLKILSPDIQHKSDVGGVRLNLPTATGVRNAAAEILDRARTIRPDARIAGVIVQPMIVRPQARELIAGFADDPTFGPVIVFGRGGTAVEVIDDKALALPPLDMKLARDLIARTRISRRLKAYRNVPAADEPDIALLLVKLSQLAADLPEVRELDINPLLADETGVLALDARIAVAPAEVTSGGRGHPRFAVRPYPKEWERTLTLDDGTTLLVRPVRPEDEAMFHRFFEQITMDDLRLRFFAPVREFSHTFIARLTQLDYARAMALAAISPADGDMLGVVHIHADPNYDKGEYAVLVRSDIKGRGLGWHLMNTMIQYARWLGLREVEGQVLNHNKTMLTMCEELGFAISPVREDPGVSLVTLRLDGISATDKQAASTDRASSPIAR
jgi:acetyltransferase